MKKLVSLTFILSLSANAAERINLVPDSANISFDNYSYLSNTKYAGDTSNQFTFLDKGSASQLKSQYETLNKQYEDKANYGLLTPTDQQNYYTSMNSMAQSMMDQVKNYQINAQKTQAIKAAQKDPSLSELEKDGKYPAMIVGGAYAIYRGTTYKMKFTDSTTGTVGGSVQSKNASVGLASPIVNTSVGADTQNLTTSLSRGVVDHISVTFSNSRPIQAGSNPTNNTISASYGMSL